MGLIIWILLIWFLFLLPYKEIAKNLNRIVELRYLLSGVVCLFIGGFYAFSTEEENEKIAQSVASVNVLDNVNHFLQSVTKPFGWVLFIAGTLMIVYSILAPGEYNEE